MSKHLKSFFIKIFALSAFFVCIFQLLTTFTGVSSYFGNSRTNTNEVEINNEHKFKKLNNGNLWNIGVAISTNIWTQHKQYTELPVTIYKEVLSIDQILRNKDIAEQELVWKNMQAIEEYKNVLRTDVKNLLDASYDKASVLEVYIDQLGYRFEIAVRNRQALEKQKNVFITSMEETQNKISEHKKKIANDFKANNAKASLVNAEIYANLQKEYFFAKTYVVYINQFLNEYAYLNQYNKTLLDVLINNKEALIKNTQLVIPNNWGLDSLKKFDLLIDEKDAKK